MPQLSDKSRKIALVTGVGRKNGIGAAVCRALVRKGIAIFFTYWHPFDQELYGVGGDEPEEILRELRATGIACENLLIDQGEVEAPKIILDEMEEWLGIPTILVNNAAFDTGEYPFDQLDAATLDRYYAVNMRGTLLLSIEFARRFAGKSGGRIINLTSGQGVGAMPGKLPYIATKGAIDAYTVTLAAELAPHGITVNAVDPGPTDTGWMTEEVQQALQKQAPMGRVGQPEDAASVIGFLASEEAGWITGQIIRSRGGF